MYPDLKKEMDRINGNMVDFLVSLLTNVGLSETEIDIEHEYSTMLEFFNTEYEELPEEKSINGYSYIH